MAANTLILIIIGIIAVGLVIAAIVGIIAYANRRDTSPGRGEPVQTDAPPDYVPTPGEFGGPPPDEVDPRAHEQSDDPDAPSPRGERTEQT
ncbi:MAG: hypothetical protein ACOC9Y_01950 [Chloroflexota bacterium]